MLQTKRMICLLLCGILLCGCSQIAPAPIVEFASAPEITYKTIVVERGTFLQTKTESGAIYYPNTVDLCCEYPNAILTEKFKFKDRVALTAGDVIATFTFDVSETELQRKELALDEAVRARDAQIESYLAKIDQYTDAAMEDGVAGRIAALRKKNAQVDLALYQSTADKNLSDQWEALEEYRSRFTDKTLVAPEDSIVLWSAELEQGTVLKEGAKLLTYTTDEPLYICVDSPASEILASSSPGLVVEVGFSSKYVKGVVVASPVGIDAKLNNSNIYIRCDELTQIDYRSSYNVVFPLLEINNALLVKKEAVRKDDDGYYVLLLQDGRAVRQNILCGPGNKDYFCILDGLEEGQELIVD